MLWLADSQGEDLRRSHNPEVKFRRGLALRKIRLVGLS